MKALAAKAGTTKRRAISKKKLEAMTVLQLAEKVIDCSRNSELDDEQLEGHYYIVDEMAARLGITRAQCLLLSVCLECCGELTIPSMARFFSCSNLRVMSYYEEIEALCRMHYIRRKKDYHQKECFEIRSEAFAAMKCNRRLDYTPKVCKTQTDLIKEIENLYTYNIDNGIPWEDGIADLRDLLSSNRDHTLPDAVLSIPDLEAEDLYLLCFLCAGMVSTGKKSFSTEIVYRVFKDDDELSDKLDCALEKGDHVLFAKGIIEHDCSGGMEDRTRISLTRKAKKDLLKDYDMGRIMSGRSVMGHRQYKDIPAKELYYNESEGRQIEQLSSLLLPDNLVQIQSRLEKCGSRKGFACLFYGAPGTGKTETVYQLARKTGRDIVEVNVDAVKSKWVGESESNIRAIFDDYREKVRDQDVAPILLFNEADAILGLRKEGASSAVDKMENAIQNIILQEMEKLEGIMIATTNLTQNLDKAFERRFIYKVRFEAPTRDVMSKIWRSMVPELSEDESQRLASKFSLSGGMIENVMRKAQVAEILTGEKSSYLKIEEYCTEESMGNQKRKLGFA